MARIGPITTENAVERTEDPSTEAVKDSVRWAVSVENSALASFYFRDRETGEMAECYQLLGTHHHLSFLNDQRIDRARHLLRRYGVSTDLLEPRLYQGRPSLDVDLPGQAVDTHVSLAIEVLEDIYNTAPSEVVHVERSTCELDRDDEKEKTAICHSCAASDRVRYMLKAYGDVYYESVDEPTEDVINGFDFVFSKHGWWRCADCFRHKEY